MRRNIEVGAVMFVFRHIHAQVDDSDEPFHMCTHIQTQLWQTTFENIVAKGKIA